MKICNLLGLLSTAARIRIAKNSYSIHSERKRSGSTL